jgi:hypothetical protein
MSSNRRTGQRAKSAVLWPRIPVCRSAPNGHIETAA